MEEDHRRMGGMREKVVDCILTADKGEWKKKTCCADLT